MASPDLGLDLQRTALLLMDFQRDIIADSAVAPSDPEPLARLDAAVANAAGVLERARASAVWPIHVRIAFAPGYPSANPHSPMFRYMKQHRVLLEGNPGTDFDPRVAPRDGEPVVTKRGIGSFAGTELDQLLHARDIRHLVLTGLVTHYVVASTAREAHDRGYDVLVLEDCCASATPARHEAALTDLRFLARITAAETFGAALS